MNPPRTLEAEWAAFAPVVAGAPPSESERFRMTFIAGYVAAIQNLLRAGVHLEPQQAGEFIMRQRDEALATIQAFIAIATARGLL